MSEHVKNSMFKWSMNIVVEDSLLVRIREFSNAIVKARQVGLVDAIPVFQAHLDKVLVEYQDHRANAQNSPTEGENNRETQNAIK